MEIELRANRIIVTGGGSGIGFAITKKLINNGCRVCITGRNAEKLQKAAESIHSDNLSVLQLDIKDIESHVPKLNEAACLLGGYYDGLVNAAGVHASMDNWNVSEKVWDDVIDTDLKAAVFIMRNAVIYMRDNNIHGNILQVASVVGTGGTNMGSAYYIAKNGLVNTTRFMGKQAAHLGIVINGVAPGLTYTSMVPNRNISPKQAAIARIIEPEEIADIALFMLSRQAAICIGETILADGGFWGAW